MLEKISKTEAEWRAILTPEQYAVLREKSTERPFSCAWLKQDFGEGNFVCAACELPLFASATKFGSGTGWPSYFEPLDREHIEEVEDRSLGMRRTEVRCGRCESHLGHVFDDLPRRWLSKAGGPPPTGKRYCINSLALKFVPKQKDE